jgi:hypothetical protein
MILKAAFFLQPGFPGRYIAHEGFDTGDGFSKYKNLVTKIINGWKTSILYVLPLYPLPAGHLLFQNIK